MLSPSRRFSPSDAPSPLPLPTRLCPPRCHLRNRLVYFRFLLSSAATVGFCICVGFTMVWLMNGVRGDWIDNVNCVCETFVTWTIVLFFGTFSSDLLGYEMRFGISKSDPGSYAVLPEGRR